MKFFDPRAKFQLFSNIIFDSRVSLFLESILLFFLWVKKYHKKWFKTNNKTSEINDQNE